MMKLYIRKSLITFLLILGFFQFNFAQQVEGIARQFIQENHVSWGLSVEDISEMDLTNVFQSQHNGVWHLYFNQKKGGIKVRNAVLNLNILNDEVVHFGNRFIQNLEEKVAYFQPNITANTAALKALEYMDIDVLEPLRSLEEGFDRVTFSKSHFARKDLVAKLIFHNHEEDKIKLIWEVIIDRFDGNDYRSVMVDAVSGIVIDEFNRLVNCQFGKGHFLAPKHRCVHEESMGISELILTDEAKYQVWPLPIESPDDGDRALVTAPHDVVASPFGWHDTNGEEGFEYNITRGNNVHAYVTQGSEPEGSDNCFFTSSFNPAWEPSQYRDASTTQLFYTSNMMHDISYRYGFDEAAGNYQENNYGNDGLDGDYVIARGQVTSQSNNADFSIDPDGQSSTMRMFLWNQMGLLTVEEPESLAGIYETRAAQFGPSVSNTAVTGEVVIADDGTAFPTLGCEPLINDDEIEGKIALVDRGVCDYSQKVVNAQDAGAIAVIVCNTNGGTFNEMGAGCCGNMVDIPAVLVPYNDCQTLRVFAQNGLIASLVQPQTTGPENLDGSLDNTIVAHEYAHGISVRLTGGADNDACLGNDEQMGEGWSDFFALAVTAKPDDMGTDPRGFSTYVLGQGNDGTGIRRFPYSTDLDVNGQTYHDIVGTARPHPVGEVWSAVLWDLYWALVDQYGFDEDIFEGTGGNNIAIQLVMDGMKMQPCNPGFIDGRDAIIEADEVNYGGANKCLIYEVFARRGLGDGAEEGSSHNRNDGKESYDLLPECIQELKIDKVVTNFINAGDNINVQLTVTNHKLETATNVVVTDLIPAETSFVTMLTNDDYTLDGGTITFEIGDLASGDSKLIAYRLSTPEEIYSLQQFLDDVEGGDGNWNVNVLRGNNIFDINSGEVYSGNFAWYAVDSPDESDFTIELKNPRFISGDQPVLRFYHWFDTEWGHDGGIVEISTDDGFSWDQVDDKIFRNNYETVLSFFTFNVFKIPAFAGDGDSYRPTYVDLSDYIGQEILVRFRFGSDEEDSGNENNTGWYIDDIEFMDMVNYNTEACVSSDEGDMACAIADSKGTIVESVFEVGVYEELKDVELSLFPNPARGTLNVNIAATQMQDLDISILTVDGKEVIHQQETVFGNNNFAIDVSALTGGFYFVRIASERGTLSKKFVISN